MFDIALGIFLFLSPIFFLPKQIGNINALQFYQFGILGNTGYNYLQLLFFGAGIITLLIIAMLTAKPQREFKDKWAVVLFALFAVSTYLHPIGIKSFSNILLGFLLYYMTVVCVKNYKILFKFIFAVALLNTIFAILQLFHINLFYNTARDMGGTIYGLMCISNQLGFYQALSIPICYALNPYLAIIPLIGLILSNSMLGIIATIVGMMYLLFPKIKKLSVSLIYVQVFLSVLLLFILKHHNFLLQKLITRGYVWWETLKLALDRYIVGYGLGRFHNIYRGGQYENPYSIFIQVFYILGISGLITLGLFLKDKYANHKDINSRAIFASCLILLVMGLGFCFMDYPRLAGTAIVLFGFLTIAKGEVREN